MKNKKSILVLCSSLLILFSLFFLIAEISPLFITAYVFAVIGVSVLFYNSMFLLKHKGKNNNPALAVLPFTTWQYLFSEILFSAVLVICENTIRRALPLLWFLLIHLLILAYFSVRFIVLYAENKSKK